MGSIYSYIVLPVASCPHPLLLDTPASLTSCSWSRLLLLLAFTLDAPLSEVLFLQVAAQLPPPPRPPTLLQSPLKHHLLREAFPDFPFPQHFLLAHPLSSFGFLYLTVLLGLHLFNASLPD